MNKRDMFDQVINRLGTYSTQWDYIEDRFGKNDLLPFTISDTDFAIPEVMMNDLKKRLNHPVFGYTRWNHEDYKGAIAKWFSERFDTSIDDEVILYSPSVMYSVARLIELNSEIGDGVIIQTPAYDAFFKTIRASKRRVIENPLVLKNDHYEIDFFQLEDLLKMEKNKILLFCSPHNPTGRVWSQSELNKVVNLCKKYNVFLISDEIHMDVVRQECVHHPIMQWCDSYSKIALCSSTSKTFNTPGLGGSYLMIPDNELFDSFQLLLKNRDGVSSASIMCVTSTISAYNKCSEWVDALNDYVDENLKFTKEYIDQNIPDLSFIVPESTYLAWIDIQKLEFDMAELQRALIDYGEVAIMKGTIYGGDGDHHLRLNVGCPRTKLVDGLERLNKSIIFLKKYN